MALIELRGVTKRFTRGDEVVEPLRDLDLDVERGEFVALLGPSGSGKTSLLNLLSAVDRASAGSVVVAGTDLTKLPQRALSHWRREHVGNVFQHGHLIPVLTAYENVELPLFLFPHDAAERHRRVVTALDAVGLGDRAHHLPRQLSGGQEQRVAIARAIVAAPPLLVADEPTGNLDRENADAVLALLRRLNAELGVTIVLVTHDAHAADFATRRIVLDKGKIVAAGGST
ncbi:MAG: ABC transporter ATP-binding protein [Planctomycetes bacterium]|nr:ABC transporter ATP-binding protein [Planctomycetota bacterium]